MIRAPSGACGTGIDGLNVRDRSTIYTAGTQTLPCKVVCGAVEIIMNFKSTASFTNHGSTPFVDCEMTCLFIESSMHLLLKHEHCQTDASRKVIEKSVFQACRLATEPLRRTRQLVPAHRRHVMSRFDQHNEDAACSLRRGARIMPIDRPMRRARQWHAIAIHGVNYAPSQYFDRG